METKETKIIECQEEHNPGMFFTDRQRRNDAI